MDIKVKIVILIALLLLLTGCIGSKKKTPPRTYITPCNVIGEDMLIRANGKSLGPSIIKNPLAKAFVDDLLGARAKDAWSSYTLDCWWGKNIGEQKDLYYCSGSYVVPELDLDNVITRYIKKEFTIGFNVEDYGGVGSFYDLTVNIVSATCSVS